MNKLIRFLLLCIVVLIIIPFSSRSDKHVNEKFYNSVSGYGWLAEDYYKSIVEKKELPIISTDDVFLGFTRGIKEVEMCYIYNFHEGNCLKVQSFIQQGLEIEVKFLPNKKNNKREFFQILKKDNKGPLLLRRRIQIESDNFFKLYRRIGERDFMNNINLNLSNEIGKLLLQGKYITPNGDVVYFMPGGKGMYKDKYFKYKIWIDYVLGPNFPIISLEEFCNFTGEMGINLRLSRYKDLCEIEFKRITNKGESELSWKLEEKPFFQLKCVEKNS